MGLTSKGVKNMKIENVLGYEREFILELQDYLKDCNRLILDDAWDYMHSYLKNFYKNGQEFFMDEEVKLIKEAGYDLKGYNDWSNVEYYLWDIIESNIYYITDIVLRYTANKEKERIDYYTAITEMDITNIVEQATEFYDDKPLAELKNEVLENINKLVREIV